MNGGRGLTPEQEAWLRDPRHPIHNGLQLDPVPNLIVIREGHPNPGNRQLRMSSWVRRNIMWPHLTRLQRVLFWSGLAALVLVFVAAPFIIGPVQCDNLSGRTVCHAAELAPGPGRFGEAAAQAPVAVGSSGDLSNLSKSL